MTRILLTTPAVALAAALMLAACGGGGGGGGLPGAPNNPVGGGGGGGTPPAGGIAAQLAQFDSRLDQVNAMKDFQFGNPPPSQSASYTGRAAFGLADGQDPSILADLALNVNFAGRGTNGEAGSASAVTGLMDNFRTAAGAIAGSLTTKSAADLKDDEFAATFSGQLGSGNQSRTVNMMLIGGYKGTGANGLPGAIAGDVRDANGADRITMPDGREYVGEFVTNP